MTQTIDPEGLATVASAKAQAALAGGDTPEAQRLSSEAAGIFETEMRLAGDEESQHLLRFFAATQYYRGGLYKQAARLAEQIVVAKLPANTRHLMPGFLRDVRERSSGEYEPRVHKELDRLWGVKAFQEVLALLAEHPFAFGSGTLAIIRAVCCELLGRFRPAVTFYRKSAQYAPDDPEILARMKELPLRLAQEGDFSKAWEYVNVQLELYPNPVSKVLASLLYYRDARCAEGEGERARCQGEQLRLFGEAKKEFTELSGHHRDDLRIQDVMLMGYKAAALALYSQGKKEEAVAACEEAVALAPGQPAPWTLTGIILNEEPSKSALAFRKAVALGDHTFYPYACLAHNAILEGNYEEARTMAAQALERGVGDHDVMRSMLLQWQAISIVNLRGSRAEAERLFREALEAAPDDEHAQKNLKVFLGSKVDEQDESGREGWSMPRLSRFLPSMSAPEWNVRSAHPDRDHAPMVSRLAGVGS